MNPATPPTEIIALGTPEYATVIANMDSERRRDVTKAHEKALYDLETLIERSCSVDYEIQTMRARLSELVDLTKTLRSQIAHARRVLAEREYEKWRVIIAQDHKPAEPVSPTADTNEG